MECLCGQEQGLHVCVYPASTGLKTFERNPIALEKLQFSPSSFKPAYSPKNLPFVAILFCTYKWHTVFVL